MKNRPISAWRQRLALPMFALLLLAAFPVARHDPTTFSAAAAEESPAPRSFPTPTRELSEGWIPDQAVADADQRPSMPIDGADPWPGGPVERSRELELTAREADAHTRRGMELAGRKAYFSARAELVVALRMLAQALDAEHQTKRHSLALVAGWRALREADDFMPAGSRLEAELDLSDIIRSHRTPVLKEAPVESLTPLTSLRCYFTFAQEQLATSVGEELAGSMALHGLGSVHRVMAAKGIASVRAARPKAMVCYQAALLASPQNYMASNELGVLFARGGRNEDARAALEHSVSVVPHSAGWHNLTVVYRQLGQSALAEHAAGQYRAIDPTQTALRGRPRPTSRKQVEWVDPSRFVHSHAGASGALEPTASRPNSTERKTSRADPARSATEPGEVIQAVAWSGRALEARETVRLCQALTPAAEYNDSTRLLSGGGQSGLDRCECARARVWQAYAQGEYVGPARTAHVVEYRLRVDDVLDMLYRITRKETSSPYRLNVGDEIRVESFTDKELNRELLIQPDGTITLQLLGQVRATGRTVEQLRKDLDQLYTKYYPVPAITVTPLKVNTKLEDLRSTVDNRYGSGGQSRTAVITPEGTIALPVVGSIQAQGLTLPELQQELNECYREEIEGIEVIPVLVERAPRFVYVLGEVGTPGRFELTGPTTVLQALSMAGSWNVGANLRQIVIFRRGEDWRLMATTVDLAAALHGKQLCPAGEIWLSDSDVVIVPKGPILHADDFIDLVFTRGIYGILPLTTSVSLASMSTL